MTQRRGNDAYIATNSEAARQRAIASRYDDLDTLRQVARTHFLSRPGRIEPPSLTVASYILTSRRQAYAVAIELMAEADHLYPDEEV